MTEFLATALTVILALVALAFWLGVAVHVAAVLIVRFRRPKRLCERMEHGSHHPDWEDAS